jgi:hypothetical protein
MAMVSESTGSPGPISTPPRRWRRKDFTFKDLFSILAGMILFRLIMKAHTAGHVLPGLNRWQFMGVLVGSVIGLLLVAYLLGRWFSARTRRRETV